MKKIICCFLVGFFLLAGVKYQLAAGGRNQSGGKTTISFSHWGSEVDAKTYADRIALFQQKNPNIDVQIQYIPDDYTAKLLTIVAGGTAPDVMQFAESIHAFSSRGQLLALDDHIREAGINLANRVGPTAAEIYSYNGKVYGIADRAGAMVLFYNKDLFDRAGVTYPTIKWTWDDMLKAAKAMTGGTGDNKTWGYATGYWWAYYLYWIYAGGGKAVDASGNVVINSPENLKAFTFMQELTTVHGVIPSRTELASIGSGASGDTLFAQGRIGFVGNGLWNIAALKDAKFNWDMVEMFGGATPPFGSALTISANSKHPQEAFNLVNFMTDVEAQRIIAQNVQDAPANVAVLNSDIFLKAPWSQRAVDMTAFSRSVDIIFKPPVLPQWASWDTIWSDEFSGVFDGTVSPRQALENAERRMRETR
jgi:multiple sugar transport system substrate-binding protein